jgi:hypothetical protein
MTLATDAGRQLVLTLTDRPGTRRADAAASPRPTSVGRNLVSDILSRDLEFRQHGGSGL